MPHKIIDTNVPLTAAGKNEVASPSCQLFCEHTINRILKGEIVVVIDDAGEALKEYRNNIYPNLRGNLAGQFLYYLLTNQVPVYRLKLAKDAKDQYTDYPDKEGNWKSENERCPTFDPDDKKWVALACRFQKDTGQNAPIVNASDRCWRVYEPDLNQAGVILEFLCEG